MKEFYLLREVFLLAILFAAAARDICQGIIPNFPAAASLPLGIAFQILTPQKSNMFSGVALVLTLLLLLFFWSKGKLGGGDVKLAFTVALLSPAEKGFRLIAISFPVSLVIGVCYLYFGGKKEYPLAPGMFLAAILELIIHGGDI